MSTLLARPDSCAPALLLVPHKQLSMTALGRQPISRVTFESKPPNIVEL